MAFALTLGLVTFLLAVIWGSPLIEIMNRLQLGKPKVDPDTGQQYRGTPAMGGLLIVAWSAAASLVINLVQVLTTFEIAESIVIPLLVMVSYGLLGAIDDYQKFRSQRGVGMLARSKIWYQFIIALIAAALLYWIVNDAHGYVAIPTVPVLFDIGLIYFLVAVFIIAGTANAINFVDGMDGLAGTIAATAFVAYGVIAFLQDQQFLVTLCFTVAGACFAFLWYNAKPAQMQMGDLGSLALGGILGVVALMTNQWLILPMIALMPLLTTLSVIMQVLYFKATGGKRIFRMAPLHYHFRLLGWSDTQVVQRWWLISVLSAMIGVALALV